MNSSKPVNALIVDDSAVAREFLAHILSVAGINVIGAVSGGEAAAAFVKQRRPDIITMDIYMPGIDGIETTRRIMETNPVPIVIVSGNWDPGEVETTFRAIEAGALSVVRRPYGPGHPRHGETVSELVRTVKLMSEIKVVRRWPRKPVSDLQGEKNQKKAFFAPDGPSPVLNGSPGPVQTEDNVQTDKERKKNIRFILIGASAGGPPVLQQILGSLTCPESAGNESAGNFPFPLLIVQHMAPGFLPGMLDWLGQTSRVRLRIAEDGETALSGTAYFAPDGFQMGLNGDGTIFLKTGPPEHGAKPSISYLFRSVAKNSFAGAAIAVLLTGMGTDGAAELKLLRDNGSVTIVQDRESSAVYGMPEAAVRLGAAALALPPDQISATLNRFAEKKSYERK